MYILFAYFDATWVYKIIGGAAAASGEGYVLSYGQVWPPLCAFDGQIFIEYLLAHAYLGVVLVCYGPHSCIGGQIHLFPSLGPTPFSSTSSKVLFGPSPGPLDPQGARSSCPGQSSSLQHHLISREANHWQTARSDNHGRKVDPPTSVVGWMGTGHKILY